MSSYNFKILGIEHVGIAIKDDVLSHFFSKILGISEVIVEEVKDQQVITEIFDTSSGKIELLKATSDVSPIKKFIKDKGQGVHHIALCVDNIDNAINYLKLKNIKLVYDTPRVGAEGHLIIFIHPSESPGILVELCQKNK